MNVRALESTVMGTSGRARFAIGAGAVVLGSIIAQPSLGALTQLSSLLFLLGIASLGLSVEPMVTGLLGGEDWDDLSSSKQMVALVPMAVVAIVLWFVVTAASAVLQLGG